MIDDTAFFRRLVEKGSDAILTIDGDSTVLFANESVERVFGYAPEELEGESLTAVMPDRFEQRHHEAVERYLTTGERGLDWNGIRLPGEHRDGHEIPLSITFEEHEYDGERVFSGIIRDVSEQEAYERALEELQGTVRQLLDARDRNEVAAVVVETAESLEFPVASVALFEPAGDALAPVARSAAAEAVLEPGTVLGAPDDPVRAAVDAGEPRRYGPDDGTPAGIGPLLVLPIGESGALAVGRPVADADAGVPEPEGEGEPISDRDAELAQLLAANAGAALNRVAHEVELRARNEQLERFASILSHDLRDPLNAAGAQVALARAEHDGDSEYLDELEAIHDRMAGLVEDVLALAREGQAVGEPEPIELPVLAETAWSIAGTGTAPLEVDDDLGTVLADEERLQTLLENLFGNAIRHAGEGVTVRMGPLESGRGFYVADDGPGIPEADRETVFDYGYTTAEAGSGLGLNIVERIATAHGWTVRATESEDGGARFEFEVEVEQLPPRTSEISGS